MVSTFSINSTSCRLSCLVISLKIISAIFLNFCHFCHFMFVYNGLNTLCGVFIIHLLSKARGCCMHVFSSIYT